MKLIAQINARRALIEHSNDKLPISVGYKIMKALKSTEDDEVFYQNKMNEIINKYAEKSPDGQIIRSKGRNVILQKSKINECNAEIKELEETEVEECKIKFTLDELSPIQFSVNELFMLESYILQD